MRILGAIFLLCLFGCKDPEQPSPPEVALLVLPSKSSECIVGRDVSTNTREIEFQWRKAVNATDYELRVTNKENGTTQTINTKAISAKLPLSKGCAFSWVVTSMNDDTADRVASETWMFYNAGNETSRAPFPAEVIYPKIGEQVFKDINNQIELEWVGTDLDNDLKSFEVFLDTKNPPENIISSPNASGGKFKIDVLPGTVYYWKIITKDQVGNMSDSGVFDFRVY